MHARRYTGERPFQCHNSCHLSHLDSLRNRALIAHGNEDLPAASFATTAARSDVPNGTTASVHDQIGDRDLVAPPKLLQLEANDSTQEQSKNVGQGRFVINSDAKEILEQCFWEQPYPSSSKQSELANLTSLTPRQVKTWFNNARSRRLKNGELRLFRRIPLRISF